MLLAWLSRCVWLQRYITLKAWAVFLWLPCVIIPTINPLSSSHSLSSMRLWIHLNGCNYFAPSSVERSQCYFPQHKSYSAHYYYKFNMHFTLICSFKKKEACVSFKFSFVTGVIKSAQYSFIYMFTYCFSIKYRPDFSALLISRYNSGMNNVIISRESSHVGDYCRSVSMQHNILCMIIDLKRHIVKPILLFASSCRCWCTNKCACKLRSR